MTSVPLVQVVDASTGRVVAASPNIEGEQPISRDVPAVGGFTSRTVGQLPIGESSFRVVAHTVTLPSGRFVIYAAASLAPVNQSTNTLVRLLATGLPILLILVAGTVWGCHRLGVAAGRARALRGRRDR